ncbi:MAG TPA: DNA replication protein DnaD [Clostridiales bacterium]|nr:DNA replication protein DnaD [Clostridiales bacterium]
MLFEERKSMLYSDTLLPDVFISEYLPMMEGDYVKIYLYWLFLCRYNRKASFEDIARTLDMDPKRLDAAMDWFIQNGLISKGEKGIQLNDLKEREIHRQYSRRNSLDADPRMNDPKRISLINTINNKFFQGVMSISWYTDIDEWFEKFRFDEDVMYSLFQHCFQRRVLNNKSYIAKVAENWFRKGIRNIFQLDAYMKGYERMRKVCTRISNRLKLGRMLTVYEEELVEKWVSDYGYDFDIIEMALKLTTNQNSPNFKYLDAIATRWHEMGLKDKESVAAEIEAFSRTRKASRQAEDGGGDGSRPGTAAPTGGVIPQKQYEQRQYDASFYEDFYNNPQEKDGKDG